MAEVVKLRSIDGGGGGDVTAMLEEAKAEGFQNLFLIGEKPDGTFSLISNLNIGYAMVLMEQAKHAMLFEDN